MARNKPEGATGEGPGESDDAAGGGANGADAQPLPPLASARQVIRKGQGMGRRPRKPSPEEPENPTERMDPPVAKRYTVTKGGRVTHTGMVQNLYVGKPITDVEYDIESLKRQGIELEEQKPS